MLEKKPAFPVYEECKRKILTLLSPLDIDKGIAHALTRRSGVAANAVSEILAMLSCRQNQGWQTLTIAEATVKYRKHSAVRATAGAFLEISLDALFRAIFVDFKNGWVHIKTPTELALEFADYIPKLKEEKRKNKVES